MRLRTAQTSRRGVTLLELVAALAVLAIAASIVGAKVSNRPVAASEERIVVDRARRAALKDGRDSTFTLEIDGRTVVVTVSADGVVRRANVP